MPKKETAKKPTTSAPKRTSPKKPAAVWKPGIDVSSHQGDIDFAKVAQTQKFAFIKATEGAHFVDRRFATNWKKLKAEGIQRGAYHFFRPKISVDDQITNFVNTVGRLDSSDLAPVLDLEVPADWTNIEQSKRVKLALAWLEGVEAKLGVKPIVYLSPSFVRDVLGTTHAAALKDYTLWIAHYTSASSPRVPAPWTDWTFWQYSETGTVNGISGPVDLDRFNGGGSALQKLTMGALLKKAKKGRRKARKAAKRAKKADKKARKAQDKAAKK